MKLKELIEKYEELWKEHSPFYEPVPYTSMLELFLKELKQLDEPKPVKVPQCVADWYEENKDDFEISLFQCVYEIFKKRNDNELNEFEIWLIDENTKPFQTLVNMHQFGYEVEEEKRYLVKVKGMNRLNGCLAYNKKLGTWYFGISGNSKIHSTNHTRKELEEANFGWVFDCPGVEIEEVK